MTSPDWLSPGIDGGKREDPRPYPSVQSPGPPQVAAAAAALAVIGTVVAATHLSI